jgi:hypothetical protein
MIKQIIVLSLCCCLAQLTFAQKVINRTVQTAGDSIVLSFDIQGKVGPFRWIVVTPIPSINGVPLPEASRAGLKAFEEKVEEERKVLSKGKQIVWHIFQDLDSFPGKDRLDFEFDLEKPRISSSSYWAVSYAASTNSPFGFSLQYLRNWGFYLSGKGNNPALEATETIGNDGILNTPDFYTINDKRVIKSYTLSGGITKRFGVRNHLYVGGGYGLKQLLWKVEYLQDPENLSSITKEEWRINENRDYSGIVGEAGVFWRFGNVVLDAGVGTIAGKEFYANLGIGYVFARRVPKPK